MPDHAKQVGILCQRVIDLLGLSMTEGQSILLGESNVAHMVSRHPADFALYGEYNRTDSRSSMLHPAAPQPTFSPLAKWPASWFNAGTQRTAQTDQQEKRCIA